ncbi:MAG: MFS transporter [Acholeplasmataceae bacterium]|nr:MFS transporter [Acholeplasmataceae bacterium]
MNKLWTRNFTILTLGSFISALGSAAAGIAFGIMIYRETGSPLALAFFTVSNIIPRMITGFLAGPFIDRHSRKKIVYTLDFTYTLLFLIIAGVLFSGFFNVFVFTAIAAFFGILDTIYQIAFMSMFPEVIPTGQHSRAYSISSLIWPISAAAMAPIAAYMIENFQYGVAMLMVFNSVTFLITACLETTIKLTEKLNQNPVKGLQFIEDLKEGFHYYKRERGILGIGILFACFSFVYAAHDLLTMPFFVSSSVYTLTHFGFIITAASIGRVVGGFIHYFFTYPPKKRYIIAVSVYFIVEILNATFLFLPYVMMLAISFLVGLLSVTSFNIRMSATQVYIPAHMRGRINSTQGFLWNIGAISGAIIIGFAAEYSTIDYRFIMMFAAVLSLLAIFFIPIRMHDEFKKIYNAEV